MSRWGMGTVGLGLAAATVGLLAVCPSPPPPPPPPAPAPAKVAPPPPPPAPVRPAGPLPALLVVQSQAVDGAPGPAKLTILRTDGKTWFPQVIEDPESNVFHKAMPWRDGILTIGATKAKLKLWKPDGDGWKATTLWERSWLEKGGKFDRLRDVEIADVDGDGGEEILLVTHDRGVVAVGDEKDGAWTFREFDEAEDTFVHEVEVGDVDGDGKKEFYATPSGRNRASGASQPGGVVRYDFQPKGDTYARTEVATWEESHAKEILVTDLDGDGKDELYVAREGHVVKEGDKPVLKSPAVVLRLEPGPKGKWKETVVATLDGEKQCRFLVPGDVDGDGKKDVVAAGMDTGLWKLTPGPDGVFGATPIEADTGGFEHATDVADLDGDGKLEIYAASEKQGTRVLRKYWWDGGAWKKEDVVQIPKKHITWNVQDARL